MTFCLDYILYFKYVRWRRKTTTIMMIVSGKMRRCGSFVLIKWNGAIVTGKCITKHDRPQRSCCNFVLSSHIPLSWRHHRSPPCISKDEERQLQQVALLTCLNWSLLHCYHIAGTEVSIPGISSAPVTHEIIAALRLRAEINDDNAADPKLLAMYRCTVSG